MRRRYSFACLFGAVLATGVVASRDAGAFCRTTTSPAPAGFDPAASSQIALADATHAADQAFARWNAVTCPGGGSPNVNTVDQGPVSAATVSAECASAPCDAAAPNAYHVIVFRDSGWEYDDPANTLALTTVTYGIDSAVLFNAEIEINSHDHKLTTAEPPPAGSFDLQTILTHEAGHFLGLAHAPKETSVMYAYYSADARELSADDIQGICEAYPPKPDAGALSCGIGAPRSAAGALGAGFLLVALAWARRRR